MILNYNTRTIVVVVCVTERTEKKKKIDILIIIIECELMYGKLILYAFGVSLMCSCTSDLTKTAHMILFFPSNQIIKW